MNHDNQSDNAFNQPLGGNQMPRFAGPATMMRLPSATSAEGLDACFVGVPLDTGTSNRAGARSAARDPGRIVPAAAVQHGDPRSAVRQHAGG